MWPVIPIGIGLYALYKMLKPDEKKAEKKARRQQAKCEAQVVQQQAEAVRQEQERTAHVARESFIHERNARLQQFARAHGMSLDLSRISHAHPDLESARRLVMDGIHVRLAQAAPSQRLDSEIQALGSARQAIDALLAGPQ